MSLWLALLIIQPFLIRNGQIKWHQLLGKFTYLFFPILVISIILVIHYRLQFPSGVPINSRLFLSCKDLLLIVPCYWLAIFYRKQPLYHARFMISASLQLIEPGLTRAIVHYVPLPKPGFGILLVFLLIDLILVTFIIKDRKQKNGRWIFPLALGITLFNQIFLLTGGPNLTFFERFTEWFLQLNLT